MLRIAAWGKVGSKFRRMRSSERGFVGSVVPRNQANDDTAEGYISKAEASPNPVIAFSRPPPLPPVLGPLVALSLLDSWLKRDSRDD